MGLDFWGGSILHLGGGFRYVLFSSLFGKMIQFHYYFSHGWFNHQLDICRFKDAFTMTTPLFVQRQNFAAMRSCQSHISHIPIVTTNGTCNYVFFIAYGGCYTTHTLFSCCKHSQVTGGLVNFKISPRSKTTSGELARYAKPWNVHCPH